MGCFWARIFANSNCPQVFLLSRQVSQLVVDYQQSENIVIFRWQLYRSAVTTIPASRWWRRRPRLYCRERSFTQWGQFCWSMTGGYGYSGDSGMCHLLFIGKFHTLEEGPDRVIFHTFFSKENNNLWLKCIWSLFNLRHFRRCFFKFSTLFFMGFLTYGTLGSF